MEEESKVSAFVVKYSTSQSKIYLVHELEVVAYALLHKEAVFNPEFLVPDKEEEEEDEDKWLVGCCPRSLVPREFLS